MEEFKKDNSTEMYQGDGCAGCGMSYSFFFQFHKKDCPLAKRD